MQLTMHELINILGVKCNQMHTHRQTASKEHKNKSNTAFNIFIHNRTASNNIERSNRKDDIRIESSE